MKSDKCISAESYHIHVGIHITEGYKLHGSLIIC